MRGKMKGEQKYYVRNVITFFILLPIFFFFVQCTEQKGVSILVKSSEALYDTLYIYELITDRELLKIPVGGESTSHFIALEETTLASISVSGEENAYLTILEPGKSRTIYLDASSFSTRGSLADSLVNFIWNSSNQMFASHGNVLFGQDNPEQVLFLFDSLINSRKEILENYKSVLTKDEWGLLNYQNKARAHSFLLFYGRIIKNYSPENSFFQFISKIEEVHPYTKFLPHTILYKLELEYLNKYDSLTHVNSFLEYIESNIQHPVLADFLKAIYLKEVIESPSYWSKHHHLFTKQALEKALEREASNAYSYLVRATTHSFYKTQSGEMAFDFKAQDSEGNEVRLSDFLGKTVVIDVWATWCGPCIQQRPNVLKYAKEQQENPDLVVVMISLDASNEKWGKYIHQSNPEKLGIELHIPNGMSSEFGEHYFVKAIPKYILIDPSGRIVNSNLPEPSLGWENFVRKE
jgi:thiol-disulfide isomerase/thioredoxin